MYELVSSQHYFYGNIQSKTWDLIFLIGSDYIYLFVIQIKHGIRVKEVLWFSCPKEIHQDNLTIDYAGIVRALFD